MEITGTLEELATANNLPGKSYRPATQIVTLIAAFSDGYQI